VVNWLVRETVGGAFVVTNQTGRFAGDLASYIDRRIYLFGGYEEELIARFVSLVPRHRRRTILDVGANVGTHTLAFARHFSCIHTFEPNGKLWGALERNVRLNGLENVHIHRVGLADRDDRLAFYVVDKPNHGLGTCSTVEQYDLPLVRAGEVDVVCADRYLSERAVGEIDAVKIDVQGFEPQVLKGLARVLGEHRPYVWVEIGSGTMEEIDTLERLEQLFPYAVRVFDLSPRSARASRSAGLEVVRDGALPGGGLCRGASAGVSGPPSIISVCRTELRMYQAQ
jgi:FkbM family methyltransferase